jgi:hypothetical protein
MMQSDLAFALVVSVVLMLLVVLSRRLCRGGKATPLAAKSQEPSVIPNRLPASPASPIARRVRRKQSLIPRR